MLIVLDSQTPWLNLMQYIHPTASAYPDKSTIGKLNMKKDTQQETFFDKQYLTNFLTTHFFWHITEKKILTQNKTNIFQGWVDRYQIYFLNFQKEGYVIQVDIKLTSKFDKKVLLKCNTKTNFKFIITQYSLITVKFLYL